MALLIWAVLAGGILGGFPSLFRHEIQVAQRETHGTCAVVSNSGAPADVQPHLIAGEILRPLKRFGGDHQIVCVPPSPGAKVRLRAIVALTEASTRSRRCREGYFRDSAACGGSR